MPSVPPIRPAAATGRGPLAPLAAALALAASLAPPAGAGEDALPRRTLTALKAATVFLKVDGPGDSGSGTGFVIRKQGQTAYVVTNHHVVSLGGRERGRFGRAAITAVFGSGTRDERLARAELLASDVRHDLAVLRVDGVRDAPDPIDCGGGPELVETMPVYILGFPLGELLAVGGGSPAITVGKGSVSSIRLNDRGEVATVQIDGDITPGNSGGPVVDAQGKLVGIAAATVRTRRIGFAVPAAALTRLLDGRVLDFHFTPRPAGPGRLDVQVELSVFDPFSRVRGVSFYYLDRDAGGARKLAGLPGVRRAELRRSAGEVVGTFTLAGAAGAEVPVAFQVVYVNGSGKTILSNPRVSRFRLGAGDRPGWPPGLPGAPPAPPVPPGGGPPVPPKLGHLPLDADGIRWALAALRSDNGEERRLAAERLEKTPPADNRAEVVEALEPLLSDKVVLARLAGVRAYVAWADKEGVPRLYELLKCDCYLTRWIVIEALARLEGPRSAEPIAACLTEVTTRPAARKALVGMGPAAEKAVRPYVARGDFVTRGEACRILKAIGTADSVEALRRAEKDPLPGVAPAAREALAEIARRADGKPDDESPRK